LDKFVNLIQLFGYIWILAQAFETKPFQICEVSCGNSIIHNSETKFWFPSSQNAHYSFALLFNSDNLVWFAKTFLQFLHSVASAGSFCRFHSRTLS
jgi:hypothetical protein